MEKMAGLARISAAGSRRGAALVRRIKWAQTIHRGNIRGGRLPGVWPRDGWFAEKDSGGKPGDVAAHSDVQCRGALAELVELCSDRAFRGVASAGFRRRIASVTRSLTIFLRPRESARLLVPGFR